MSTKARRTLVGLAAVVAIAAPAAQARPTDGRQPVLPAHVATGSVGVEYGDLRVPRAQDQTGGHTSTVKSRPVVQPVSAPGGSTGCRPRSARSSQRAWGSCPWWPSACAGPPAGGPRTRESGELGVDTTHPQRRSPRPARCFESSRWTSRRRPDAHAPRVRSEQPCVAQS
jgi:hypothetical protein